MSASIAPTFDRPAFRQRLESALGALHLDVHDERVERLLDYVELLARWNRTYNLTAVRDPADMLTQHVFDCLAALAAVTREGLVGKVLDVGSGGGLPGVVWAIMAPSLDVTCVDSVGKKAAFVRQVATTLTLPNLHSRHARVEGLRDPAYDVIVSRAFASLADFVAATRCALGARGVWAAMKGRTPVDEIAALPPDVEVFHVEPLSVPELSADRCIVWMRPRSSSGAGYGESVHIPTNEGAAS